MIAKRRGVVVERGVDADSSAQQVSDPVTRLQCHECESVAESDLARGAGPQIYLAAALVRRDRTRVSLTLRHPLESVSVNERLSFENCAKMVCFYTAYIQEMATLPGELDAGGSVADADDEDVQELIVDSMAWEDDEDIPIPTLEETMAFGEEDEADIEDNGDDSSAEEPA